MTAALEVELKLRAEDEAPLWRLAAIERLARCVLGPPREFSELDRYLDTADRRLGAARWACRLRTRDGSVRVSLKGPAEHQAGDDVHRRPELEGPAAGDLDVSRWPPSAARDHLLRLTGSRPLVELLVLRQVRIEREVSAERQLGVLSLDRVVVLAGGAERGRFLAVELELAADAVDGPVADAAFAELRAMDGLTPEPRSKLERALAMLSSQP
ncbi:MAG TPA: CYTH domain-containing protein [Candidatus Limnocylindria bacterium]|jgi:inorganic triphosphatase YgiF